MAYARMHVCHREREIVVNCKVHVVVAWLLIGQRAPLTFRARPLGLGRPEL